MSVVPRNLNLPFLVLVAALGLAILTAYELGVDGRLVSTLTGAAALYGIVFRLVTTWSEVPVLVHVLSLVIVGFLILGALAQLQLGGFLPGPFQRGKVPLSIAVWPGVGLRVAIIVIALFWPRWVDRRESPFRR